MEHKGHFKGKGGERLGKVEGVCCPQVACPSYGLRCARQRVDAPQPRAQSLVTQMSFLRLKGTKQPQCWEGRLYEGWLPRLEPCLHYVHVSQPGLARVMLCSLCA